MIDAIRGLVHWQKSISENRTLANLDLKVAPATLKRHASLSWYSNLLVTVFNEAKRRDVPIEFSTFGVTNIDDLVKYILQGNFDDDRIFGLLFKEKGIINSSTPELKFTYSYGAMYDRCSITAHSSRSMLNYLSNYIETIQLNELLTAELYDKQYVNLQSTGTLSQYKYTRGLKLTEDPEWVDTTNRPGRGATLPGTQFGLFSGTAHYWFGGMTFDNYIPKDRILAFTDAEEVTELPNGIVYVHLYKNMFKGHEPEAQRRQLAFRKHLGLV